MEPTFLADLGNLLTEDEIIELILDYCLGAKEEEKEGANLQYTIIPTVSDFQDHLEPPASTPLSPPIATATPSLSGVQHNHEPSSSTPPPIVSSEEETLPCLGGQPPMEHIPCKTEVSLGEGGQGTQEIQDGGDSDKSQNNAELPQENVSTKTGRFFNLPKSGLVLEALNEGTCCQVLGMDIRGHVFIAFPSHQYNENHAARMTQMKNIYNNFDLIKLRVCQEHLEPGEILVAKKSRELGFNKMSEFHRVQVLEIGNWISVVDIDERTTHRILVSELYKIMEYFYMFPTRGVKCKLAGLTEFSGSSGIIPEAVRASGVDNFDMFVKGVQNEGDEFPEVFLYSTQIQMTIANWSFNQSISKLIMKWNAPPLNFKIGMILLRTKITCASVHGAVWVQMQSGLMTELANLRPLVDLDKVHPTAMLNDVSSLIRSGQIIFVKKVASKFRRVKIIQDFTSDDHKLQIVHIDYGIRDVADLSELISFEYFPAILEKVPAQGFTAWIEMDPGVLTEDSIQLLTSASSIKVQIIHMQATTEEDPLIRVYFLKQTKKIFKKRPTSQCSNASISSARPGNRKQNKPSMGYHFPLEKVEKKDADHLYPYSFKKEIVINNDYKRHSTHLTFYKAIDSDSD